MTEAASQAPVTRRQRRELAALIALIALAAIAAAAVPVAGAVVAVLFAVVWSLSARESRTLLADGLHTYHAPPFARACDCAVAVGRHARAFVRGRSRRALGDTALSLAFFALIIAAIAVLEAEKHAPHLAHAGVGLAVGIAGWHIALEVTHEPERLARYRHAAHSPVSRAWVFAALLLFELAVFLVFEAADEFPHHPFVRGLFSGVAAMGLADAATLASTLVAIALAGRPLR